METVSDVKTSEVSGRSEDSFLPKEVDLGTGVQIVTQDIEEI